VDQPICANLRLGARHATHALPGAIDDGAFSGLNRIVSSSDGAKLRLKFDDILSGL
jgi:hypothetical protein